MQAGFNGSANRTLPSYHPVAVQELSEEEAHGQLRMLHKDYLDLVRRSLVGDLVNTSAFGEDTRTSDGGCKYCFTQMSPERLRKLQELLWHLVSGGVPGDVVDVGSGRGGSSILPSLVLDIIAPTEGRNIWICDSFKGPPPAVDPHDLHLVLTESDELTARDTLMDTLDNFDRFNARSDSTNFVSGYFNETMPGLRDMMDAQGRHVALLHIDGGSYASVKHALHNLYPLVSISGYVVCGTCSPTSPSFAALQDFFHDHDMVIEPELVPDRLGAMYWQKSAEVPVNAKAYYEWRKTFRGA